MKSMNVFTIMCATVAAIASAQAGCKTTCCEMMFGKDDPSDQPVTVNIAIQEASATNGVTVRVELENHGAPLTLRVCPAMKLCCVDGLHPMIGAGDSGMGLRDTCTMKNPTPHETFLPTGTSFCFSVTIPPSYVPEGYAKPGKTIRIQFCFELGDETLVHSNTVEVELK